MLFSALQVNQQPLLFRGIHDTDNNKTTPVDESDLESIENGKNIYCKLCNRKITNEILKITIGGKIEHTFFNPNGNLFLIGCFKEAPGCQMVGSQSSEFSWFPGFSWQIVTCLGCHEHLGWLFVQGDETYFFGLILPRLKSDN
jgi:hypothetical protein